MKEGINPSNKLRVIFSLSPNSVDALNGLAMKSNRSRSGVIGILIDNAQNHEGISKILGGTA